MKRSLRFLAVTVRSALLPILVSVAYASPDQPAQSAPQGAASTPPPTPAHGAEAIEQPKPMPKFINEFGFKYYVSPSAGLKHNGSKVGNATIQRYSFDYQMRYLLAEGLYLTGGVYGNYMDLNADSSTLLPDRLQAIGFIAGVNRDLSDWFGKGWNTMAVLRPLLTTASSSFSDPGFVLQGLWLFSYRQNEAMTWTGGIVFSTHADIPALPVVGLRWDFAEDWSTFIGFPEASVSYKILPELTLRGLVALQQGSYKVKNAPAPSLNDTYLDYREVRLGVGIDYKITRAISVGLDGGAALGRRFTYVDRGYKLKGDTAAYLNLTVDLKF